MQYLIYYSVVNILLFVLMGMDKLYAKLHKWRIKEATLLILSLIGGGLGGFFGMHAFHHKTQKKYFTIIFILSIITHTIIFICIQK